jgi:DNA primase
MLRDLVLPAAVRAVIILADGDEAGISASRAAAARWLREGRQVRIAYAPAGKDFNDLLVAEAHHA